MAKQFFKLNPFPAKQTDNQNAKLAQLKLAVEGQISRLGTSLVVHFVVLGACDEVQWPSISQSPQRRDNLWQHTCFELFLSEPNSKEYIEYNFSPSHDWNAYQFQNYRTASKSVDCETPNFEIIFRSGSRHEYQITVPLPQPQTVSSLNVGITTVIASKNSHMLYFALIHTGTQPDFHRRDSFITVL